MAEDSRRTESAKALRTGVGPSPAGRPEPAEAFEIDGVRGEIVSRVKPLDLAGEIRRLTDPATATETIHWGRNYLYRTQLQAPEGPLDVVVKQFRNQGLLKRWRRRWRGSKATRSWRTARGFEAAGIKTAEALVLIESKHPEGPSLFVARHLGDVVEARYLLRAINRGVDATECPGLDLACFFDALGRALRRMHEAGFFHRDLSIGNVLLPAGVTAPGPQDLYLIDLNRARRKRRLSLSERTRDLCRLAIFKPEHQRLFLEAYWGGELGPWRAALYQAYHRGFLFKIESKKKVRAGTRGLLETVLPRRAHAHIPDAPLAASRRDKIVWDHLSDQPHQHAGRFEKLTVRLVDAPIHLRQTAAAAAAAPRILRRYRELRRELYQRPVPWDGVGVCVRPWPAAPDRLLAAIDELGVGKILLRLHPWDLSHDAEEELARELIQRGYELSFALPQNRELVRDRARWRGQIEELAERFTPYGRHFQVGQAINRSKWGIWRYGEYLDLAACAAEILRRDPKVEILGPAVIDFEYHVTAAILNWRQTDLSFDVLSSLLYVDRRGAPEASQFGFDTVGKVLLAQAIADTARNCGPRSWITEVNWPLREGPHSPAGRTVTVSPKIQADYLARYFLLALTTGAVERVYWWQLVARGYGLLTPCSDGPDGELLRRPSFQALATLDRELRGSTFIGPKEAPPGARLLLFKDAGGRDLMAGWSTSGNATATLPRPARQVVEQDGRRLEPPPRREIELSESVRYFRF